MAKETKNPEKEQENADVKTADTSPVKIQVKELCKSFGSKKVLDGIDLTVRSGESLVVIGGSGSGKSVLLKSILGLLYPDSGEILIDNKNIIDLSVSDREKLMQKFRYVISRRGIYLIA